MYIYTDHIDDENGKIEVFTDNDRDFPITLKIKLGNYATRVTMNRDNALDIMSKLEHAVHKIAEAV